MLSELMVFQTWLAVQELPAVAEASTPAETLESQPDALAKRLPRSIKAKIYGIYLVAVAFGATTGYYGILYALNGLVIAMVYLAFAGVCTMVCSISRGKDFQQS